MQVVNYSRYDLINDPSFAWWCSTYLCKCKIIISNINSRYWNGTQKYGIRFPKSVEEAVQIDKDNGETQWKESTDKDMTKNSITFDVREEGEAPPRGYK